MNKKITKEERLHSKKQIEHLFDKGRSFFIYPFKVYYYRGEDIPALVPTQIFITVPKRSFKKAVDRNRLKRLVRESYRKNKEVLLNYQIRNNKCMILGLVYVGVTILSYQEIERKLILILHRLIEQDEEHIG